MTPEIMRENLPKIAFLLGNTSTNGGIERVTSILSDELTEKGFAKIYAIGFQPKECEPVYEWNKKITIFDLLVKRESMKTGIFKAIIRLRRYLKNNNIDILVACGHRYAPLAGLATVGTNTKMIYWSHSSFYGEIDTFKKFNEHFGSLISNVVVPLTKTDEQNYRNKTRAKKVIQIYNPIDEHLLNHNIPYNPNTKRIISVGRLDHPKNFESHLLEVAKIVLTNNPEYTWHIYGKGGLESIIKSNIEKEGLTGRVILEGNVNNLYNLYSGYSLMVMTSSYEGFPMTLIEGMAKKLPLVSFDVQTGPNEIIQDNLNGFLIPPFNLNLMAQRIDELIHDQDMRIKFSEANKTLIENYKIDVIIDQWATLIKSLVNK
tara:strand:- start:1524 stop:2645 length:1122 start_codon:yes stop_codon:yes gene_type:complete